MPHTIKRPSKKIVLNSGITIIFKCLEEAILVLSLEQRQALGIDEVIHSRGAKVVSFLREKTEEYTGQNVSAKGCRLLPLEANLNELGFTLYKRYIKFINNLVKEVGKAAKQLEAEEIDSRYGAIRELLFRLLAVALSDEENNKRRDTGNFIKAMQVFTDLLLSREELKLDDRFRYSLCEAHPQWLSAAARAVDIVSLIHLPQSTFATLVNYLDKINRAIKAHLIVGLGLGVLPADLSTDWIDTTFEQVLYGGPAEAEPEPVQALELTAFQERQLLKVKASARTQLQQLFLLLNQTELLARLVGALDSVISVSHSVLLLTGEVNFTPLIELIEAHRHGCNEIVSFGRLGFSARDAICRHLITVNLLCANRITVAVPEICNNLLRLGSFTYQSLIMAEVDCNFSQLMVYQKKLGIRLIRDRLPEQVLPRPLLRVEAQATTNLLTMKENTMRTKSAEPGMPEIVESLLPKEEARPSFSLKAEQVRQFRNHTPNYIKVFCNQFKDKNFEATVNRMWEKTDLTSQMTKGGKDRPQVNSLEVPEGGDPDDFLYRFTLLNELSTGPLCAAVARIIQAFEKEQMEYSKPFTWRRFFNLDNGDLWESRHYELCYLKFLCVENSDRSADEIQLKEFISTVIRQAEKAFGSNYNTLLDELEKLLARVEKGELVPCRYATQAGEVGAVKQGAGEVRQLYEKKCAEAEALKGAVAKQESENHSLKAQLLQKDVQAKEKDDKILSLYGEIGEKNNLIIALFNQNKDLLGQLAEKNNIIEGNQTTIKQQNDVIIEKNEVIGRLSKDLDKQSKDFEKRSQDFDKQSKDFDKQSKDFEKQSKDFEKQSKDFEKQSKDFEKQSKDFEKQSKDFEKQSKDFEEQSKMHQQEINDLKARQKVLEDYIRSQQQGNTKGEKAWQGPSYFKPQNN
jgi:hypothetical protein